MLLLIGKALEVAARQVTPANGGTPFTVREVRVLVHKSRVETVELAKDFRGELPSEGDEVALEVSVKAFTRQNGTKAGYSFTAWADQSAAVKVAATV